MAYLDRRSFDIVGLDHDGYFPQEALFYVDDALAETIQLLNTRGYITEACRAGDIFGGTQEITVRNVRDSRGMVVHPGDVAAAYLKYRPGSTVLRAREIRSATWALTVATPPRDAYIRFRDEQRFKRLPAGGVYMNRTLRRATHIGVGGLERLEALTAFHRALLDWAAALPLSLSC